MRYLALAEVVVLHHMVIAQTGGASGLRDLRALESALGQPRQTFGGADLYPDVPAKAAAMAYSLIQNHPFVDGNKRVGHAAMEIFLVLNGYEFEAGLDDAEHTILNVASGRVSREELAHWVVAHTGPIHRES